MSVDERRAIELATDLVRREGISVGGLHSAQRFFTEEMCRTNPSARIPEAFKGKGDYWVVRFRLKIPDGEVWCPDEVLVEVDETTGAATILPSL